MRLSRCDRTLYFVKFWIIRQGVLLFGAVFSSRNIIVVGVLWYGNQPRFVFVTISERKVRALLLLKVTRGLL
jgi:hypothetical protein